MHTHFDDLVEVIRIDNYVSHVLDVIRKLQNLPADSDGTKEAVKILKEDIHRALDYKNGVKRRLYS